MNGVQDTSLTARRNRIHEAEPIFKECRMELRELERMVASVLRVEGGRMSPEGRQELEQVRKRLLDFITALR